MKNFGNIEKQSQRQLIMAGGARPGAGRPKGVPNKASIQRQARVALTGITPLDYMLEVLRDPLAASEDRKWAAQNSAPYVHPKLAAVTHKGDPEHPLESAVKIYLPSNGRD